MYLCLYVQNYILVHLPWDVYELLHCFFLASFVTFEYQPGNKFFWNVVENTIFSCRSKQYEVRGGKSRLPHPTGIYAPPDLVKQNCFRSGAAPSNCVDVESIGRRSQKQRMKGFCLPFPRCQTVELVEKH